MNVLLLASHAVAEYDDLRMFTDLGFDVFAPGGYEVPSRSGEGIRPALPDAPHHPDFVDLCNRVRAERGDPGPDIDWAKAAIPDDIIDWADAIIVHHFVDRWIGLQWDRIKHKRVIWRTCGQSNTELEAYMMGFGGLQIVRYSPNERRYFEHRGVFAGEDALVRFGKYASDYGPWSGDDLVIGNITQDMAQRGDATGLSFWLAATEGLPTKPAGPGSQSLRDGIGALPYDEMLEYLRRCRAYLYTGTRPASYTLGLIEALLSGVPVVSIGRHDWGRDWGGEMLFEADSISGLWSSSMDATRSYLTTFLDDIDEAARYSRLQRDRALDLFSVETVGAQWGAFLS